MLLVDSYKRDEQKAELRLWKVIETVTVYLGRKDPMPPASVFPLLKDLRGALDEDDDNDDVDPRQAFQTIGRVMSAGRGMKPITR